MIILPYRQRLLNNSKVLISKLALVIIHNAAAVGTEKNNEANTPRALSEINLFTLVYRFTIGFRLDLNVWDRSIRVKF